MSNFSEYNIDSGSALYKFLEDSGLLIEKTYQTESTQNIIYLPDKTTFNWKKADHVIRVNCKEDKKELIEKGTKLSSIDNGGGDSTRPYSFWIYHMSDLIDVIYVLKRIQSIQGEV